MLRDEVIEDVLCFLLGLHLFFLGLLQPPQPHLGDLVFLPLCGILAERIGALQKNNTLLDRGSKEAASTATDNGKEQKKP